MFNHNNEELTKFLKENDEMFKFIKDINQAFGSLDSLVKLMEGINGKKMTPDQKQTLSKMTGLSLVTTLTDHSEQELPVPESKAPCFTPPTPNPIPQPSFNPYGSHPSQQFNQQPCFTPPTPNPIPQPSFNPYGSHPSQQFNQQPCFTPPTPNPIPQQPYGQHPSFGHTPYPPQQPYGQDITLMRIMEQLYSLSEKVDLLLRKQ